ncbi:MAG: hypothetical protein VKN72_19680 [Nostocales cyanobacterium 94392]|nr:hypothetical protein [Nostocales cyanobacterium 94392]
MTVRLSNIEHPREGRSHRTARKQLALYGDSMGIARKAFIG